MRVVAFQETDKQFTCNIDGKQFYKVTDLLSGNIVAVGSYNSTKFLDHLKRR